MSDYSNSVIYNLTCKDKTVLEIYIGSTHDENIREQRHKSSCNNVNNKNYNFKVYEFIRANGGYDNWKFEILERYPCDNKTQLRIRERYYYDLFNPELNTNRPYVSEEEMKEHHTISQAKYCEENQEKIKECNAKYREENQEKIKKCNAKYREENQDEIKKYQAQYRDENKEEKKECNAKYREENKECNAKYREENKAKINQKHICECGGKYTSSGKSQHCKTNKHKTFIEKTV